MAMQAFNKGGIKPTPEVSELSRCIIFLWL